MTQRESDAYLAAIVASSDDAIISKDLDGVIQTFNAAAERLFGYREAEIVGKSIQILIPRERQGEEVEILARLRRGERIDHFETLRLAKDGRVLEVSLTVSPVRNAAGAIIGASKIAREIGEHRRIARESALLAAIVESSDDAIISKDLDGVIQTFNAAAQRIFGYTAAEIVGKPVTTLIPPDRRDEELEILARIRRGERVDHFETVRMKKGGELFEVSLTISPVRDASGTVVGASKIARDVSEQRRASRALAEQQEWFRTTLSSIGDAVLACDRHGNVIFLNHEAERLTGWTHQSAHGAPLRDVFCIVNENTRTSVDDPATTVLRLGRAIALANHTLLIGRDGVEWPIADSASPIVGKDGDVVGVVLVFREISAQQRLEQLTRTTAAERELLLQSERAARTEAERANRVKDDFVAMVSHELRTPLNAILGWTQVLMAAGTDEAMRAHGLEVIARNTRLQAQLISDLLDVSRIISGKLLLEFANVDFVEVVKNSVEALQSSAAEKGVELTATLVESPLVMAGDAARLQQIVLNLLSNAVKFTPKGGSIALKLRRVGEDAELSVTDTGVGIRAEVMSDIFERFRQGMGATTRRHGGLGLGLWITKHLTELHGGSVRVWSAGENKGSTFTVELPITLARAPTATRQGESEALADDRVRSLRELRVLLVEDDQDTRDLVRRLLEGQGAIVSIAASALEALEILESVRPSLLVSDIGLPDIDGYELIRRVRRRHDTYATMPAVALSAFARVQDKAAALRAGFNVHIAKPVEPVELVVTIAGLGDLVTRTRAT